MLCHFSKHETESEWTCTFAFVSSMRELSNQSLRDTEKIGISPCLCSWILPNFQCNLVQDERRLSSLSTSIIPRSIRWSSKLRHSWRFSQGIDGRRFAYCGIPSLTFRLGCPHLAPVACCWLSLQIHHSAPVSSVSCCWVKHNFDLQSFNNRSLVPFLRDSTFAAGFIASLANCEEFSLFPNFFHKFWKTLFKYWEFEVWMLWNSIFDLSLWVSTLRIRSQMLLEFEDSACWVSSCCLTWDCSAGFWLVSRVSSPTLLETPPCSTWAFTKILESLYFWRELFLLLKRLWDTKFISLGFAIDFFGAEFWDTQPRTFSFSIAIAPWVLSFFDLLLEFSSPPACRYRELLPWMHLFPDLSSQHTGRCRKSHDDLSHLAPHWQGIFAPVAGLASRLVERLSSVCPFPVGTEEDACSLPFLHRSFSTAGLRLDTLVFFTSSADVSPFPRGMRM